MIGRLSARAVLVAVLALSSLPLVGQGTDGWRPFTATWTLSGQRHLLPTEGSRPASIVHLSGPLVVTSGEGLGKGLLGEVIGYDDGGSLLAGRAVLTDERGDHVFCSLKAEPIGEGRTATATITGGTGRFSTLEGTFTFSWQYVVSEGTEEISGRAVNLTGKTRPAATRPASPQRP